MPGWYASLKPQIEDGSVVLLGVIQEQHADRCRLFKQWQQLDFPVVQDLLNTNGIAVVPVYVLIDEQGVVRGKPRSVRSVADFLASPEKPATAKRPVAAPSNSKLETWNQRLQASRSVDHLVGAADQRIQWKPDANSVLAAIKLYQEAVKKTDAKAKEGENQKRSDLRFRLGAAYRLLYELQGQADAELFRKSVTAWEMALKLNPNQYIYRRRIEQYGPRLKKPYSFYDWIGQARKEIQARGEVPLPLPVEPNGAELAQRARTMQIDSPATNPDPTAAITLDEGEWVQVHANVVPSRPKLGDVVAIHLGFHLNRQAKWNHETEPMKVWIDPPTGGLQLSSQLVEDQTPYATSESRQPISISFEAKLPSTHQGPITLTGYALFNICESANGQCVFRRRNFRVTINP